MSFHKSFSSGTDTSDATAAQWDIKNGKTAYIASGKVTGSGYFPAMMAFDGSTGYYSDTYTSSGNQCTAVARFRTGTFTGNVSNRILAVRGPGASNPARIELSMGSSDQALTTIRNKILMICRNSANAVICLLVSSSTFADDSPHTIFASFDGDSGAATFRIDGTDEDDTGHASRVAPTTGALDSGASTAVYVGSVNAIPASLWPGEIGFVGYRDTYLTNWSDFMQTDGHPKQISEASASPQWAEWGAQPLFWHESGKMDENKGSAGAMAANGTITLAAASTWS